MQSGGTITDPHLFFYEGGSGGSDLIGRGKGFRPFDFELRLDSTRTQGNRHGVAKGGDEIEIHAFGRAPQGIGGQDGFNHIFKKGR